MADCSPPARRGTSAPSIACSRLRASGLLSLWRAPIRNGATAGGSPRPSFDHGPVPHLSPSNKSKRQWAFPLHSDLRFCDAPISLDSRQLATGTAEHESALERDFVTLTSFLHPDASIISQPVTLTFRDNAKSRRYTPDFLVEHSAAPAELVEVKYRADLRTNWMRLKPGFVVARAWARKHGAAFRIATERSIRGSKLDNARRLLPLRQAPLDPGVAELVLSAMRSEQITTFGDVLAAVPVSRQAGLAALWRLIARGRLRVDLAAPITFDTRVSII